MMNKVYDLVMEDKVPRFLFNDRESTDSFLISVQWHMNTYGYINLCRLICCYFGAVYKLDEDLLYSDEDYRSACLEENFNKEYFSVSNFRSYIDEFTYEWKRYESAFSTDAKPDHDPLGFFRSVIIHEFEIMSEVKHE